MSHSKGAWKCKKPTPDNLESDWIPTSQSQFVFSLESSLVFWHSLSIFKIYMVLQDFFQNWRLWLALACPVHYPGLRAWSPSLCQGQEPPFGCNRLFRLLGEFTISGVHPPVNAFVKFLGPLLPLPVDVQFLLCSLSTWPFAPIRNSVSTWNWPRSSSLDSAQESALGTHHTLPVSFGQSGPHIPQWDSWSFYIWVFASHIRYAYDASRHLFYAICVTLSFEVNI